MRSPKVILIALLVASCADDPARMPDVSPQFAPGGKGGGGGGLAVTGTNPSFGRQGDTNKRVVVTGSGFVLGSEVEWQRGGVADPHVTVLSVEYISSTQLAATIDIATDAEISLYDVVVISPLRKQGIGTEMFEVTAAIPLGGGSGGRDVNDAGAIVGSGFYYLPETGLVELNPELPFDAGAFEIDAASSTIVGHVSLQSNGKRGGTTLFYGVTWSWNGTGFGSYVKLPIGTTTEQSHAYAISNDGLISGGSEVPPLAKGQSLLSPFPMLWFRNGSTWQRQSLPLPAGSARAQVRDVNDSGWAVGNIGADLADHKGGVIWERTGATSWTPRVLSPTGVVNSLNTANDIAVGWIIDSSGNESARYWRRNADGSWTMFVPPGNCKRASTVANTNAIVLKYCPDDGRTTGAVLTDFVNLTFLSGLGNRLNSGDPGAISPNGSLITGWAQSQSGSATSVKWEFF